MSDEQAGRPDPGDPYPGQHPTGQPYPGPYPYAAGQPYPGYAPGYAYPRNDLAVWSLVLGIASFVLGCLFFTGIPAVVLGNKAKQAVAAGEANNPGLASAGVVLGWISIVLGAVGVVFAVLAPLVLAGVFAGAHSLGWQG
ncbi:DUF4190 domain-containing protein [Cellulomonas sp. P22]|uniref:DUF4190 domain-containing protein n=1 Tax=Cellulomonas sp. P22 TaxID=3373189 RepID=UPI0037A17216